MRICICPPYTEPLIPALRAVCPDAEIAIGNEHASDFEIVIGNPALSLLQGNKGLRLLQLRSAGTDPYTRLYQTHPALVICCATGAYGHAVGEHMFSMMLCIMKHLDGYARQQASEGFLDLGKAGTIRGANVLVLGFGDIGAEFGRMCRALGAFVTGIRKNPSPEPGAADRILPPEALDSLLPQADVIAMALPETPETINIMNRERLRLVKKGAYLLNVGRGSAIDEDALYDALSDGTLAAAAVDVLSTEPLPPGHRLWKAKNLLITPHIAGGDHLDDIGECIARIAAGNLRTYMEGGTYTSYVDPQTGYRAR